jgi:hypothetical protein
MPLGPLSHLVFDFYDFGLFIDLFDFTFFMFLLFFMFFVILASRSAVVGPRGQGRQGDGRQVQHRVGKRGNQGADERDQR